MNENQQKWIEALRSGEYLQARETLHSVNGDEHRYCCLGVACELYNKEVPEEAKLSMTFSPYEDDRSRGNYKYGYKNATLPNAVCEWLDTDEWGNLNERVELESPDDTQGGFAISGDSLTVLNDRGASFEQIAGIIESGILKPGLIYE